MLGQRDDDDIVRCSCGAVQRIVRCAGGSEDESGTAGLSDSGTGKISKSE